MGGGKKRIRAIVTLLDKTKFSVLEKIASTLWICSINVENRAVIREYGAFPKLVSLLSHSNTSIIEKSLGTLRNCSTLRESANKPLFEYYIYIYIYILNPISLYIIIIYTFFGFCCGYSRK